MKSLVFLGMCVCACVQIGRAQQQYAKPVYMPISLKKNPCDHAQTMSEGRLYVMTEPALEGGVECTMNYDPDVKRIYSDRKGRYLVDSFTVSCYKLSGAAPAQLSLTPGQSTCSRWHPHIKPVKVHLRFDDANMFEKFHVLLYVKRSKYQASTYCTVNQEPLPARRHLGSDLVAFAYRTMCVHSAGN